ncbi:hypothetical protein BST13_14380 [Mycobacterium aquaticum]|uniref:Uncharacterized protein n=2 Tax=Mycobacterium aquaticum TaxID=1927124 RepID=A0A1X0AZ41_9MYCO|nr:hypothetical protein BST13_14380 [Mycobacterium aquaticum]
MGGAIASADPEPDSTSGAAQANSSGSVRDAAATVDRNVTSTAVSGATADKSGSTLSAQTNTSAQPVDNTTSADHTVTTTTASGTGPNKPTSTLSAQTNTSAQTADNTTTTAGTTKDPTSADHTITTTTVSGISPEKPSSTLAAEATTSTASASSDTSGQPAAHATTLTDGAQSAPAQTPTVPLSIPANEPSISSTPATAASVLDTGVATAITGAATPAKTPTPQYAIAYFLRTLAVATDVVQAIIQLPADVSAALGIVWAAPGAWVAAGGSVAPGVEVRHVLVSAPDGGLVTLVAPSRLLEAGLSSDAGRAPTIGFSGVEVDPGIMLLASMQPQSPAAALAQAIHPHHSARGLIADAVTAVAVSIWALLYSALSGLGGMLSFGAVGVRIGYRQSSAGIALHSPELARFARPGPIGVVRTGSLVSVHIRNCDADRTTRHLRRVA